MTLTPPVLTALREATVCFNAAQYWECHEVLENVWLTAEPPLKTFLHGLIQVAAGCHHLVRNNRKGTLSLLQKGLTKLEATEDCTEYENVINSQTILKTVKPLFQAIQNLPENNDISAFQRQLIKWDYKGNHEPS